MILGVYVMRDIKVGFLQPTFESNDAVAIRNFKFAMNSKDSILHANPADFDLFKIGIYDTDRGEIKPLEHYDIICSGIGVINDEV